MVLNGHSFIMNDEVANRIKTASEYYRIKADISLGRYDERQYKRCHQMYHFPMFCADGKIYICCENKGNPQFALGNWDSGDFRDLWLTERHHDIYQKTNVAFCQPCRPNITNISIQNILDDPKKIEALYL